jgi:hypothetical protein
MSPQPSEELLALIRASAAQSDSDDQEGCYDSDDDDSTLMTSRLRQRSR